MHKSAAFPNLIILEHLLQDSLSSSESDLFNLLADKEVPQDDPTTSKSAKSQLKPPVTVDYGDEDEAQSLFWRHFAALSIKRFHHSRRNKKGLLCEASSYSKSVFVLSCFSSHLQGGGPSG